jgi:hypothetical protein
MAVKKPSSKQPISRILRSDWRLYSQILVSGSIIAVLLATLGYLGVDIWLASTQWLIVAAVLGILGIYAKLESNNSR